MAGNSLNIQDRKQVRDILSLIADYDEAVAKIAALGPAVSGANVADHIAFLPD